MLIDRRKRLVQKPCVPFLILRVLVCLHWLINPQILHISCQQYTLDLMYLYRKKQWKLVGVKLLLSWEINKILSVIKKPKPNTLNHRLSSRYLSTLLHRRRAMSVIKQMLKKKTTNKTKPAPLFHLQTSIRINRTSLSSRVWLWSSVNTWG